MIGSIIHLPVLGRTSGRKELLLVRAAAYTKQYLTSLCSAATRTYISDSSISLRGRNDAKRRSLTAEANARLSPGRALHLLPSFISGLGVTPVIRSSCKRPMAAELRQFALAAGDCCQCSVKRRK